MKVEWRNAGFATGTPDDFVNVQVWLYQRTGAIEIRMGSSSVGSQTAFNNGPWLGAFMANPTFTRSLGKCWIYGDPAAPKLDTSTNLNFRRLNNAPTDGTIYRLVPTETGPASVERNRTEATPSRMDLSER